MRTRLIAALPALCAEAVVRADTGGALEGAALSGLMALGASAVAVLMFAVKERRREQNRPAPVRLRVKARRYNQP